MAANTKASKWFSNKTLRVSDHRRSQKPLDPSVSSPDMPSSSSGTSRMHELQQVFKQLDGDGDGKISAEELRSFFDMIGEDLSFQEAKSAVGDLDSDGDGMIDFMDFARLMETDGENNKEDEDLRRAFEMFEIEKGSGCITPNSLQRMLSRLGDTKSYEECKVMIQAFDVDGNGVLDYQEFCRMMT